MISAALAWHNEYAALTNPVPIIVGEDNRMIDTDEESVHFTGCSQSTLRRIPGVGHMVDQSATDVVMTAIDEAKM